MLARPLIGQLHMLMWIGFCLVQAPVLLRLAFHDAATHRVSQGDGGANASIQYEFERPENTGLKRGW